MKDKIKMRNIKVYDSAVNVGERIKNVGIKTKDTINENINHSDNVSSEQYASDKVTEAMKSGLEMVAVGSEKAVRKGTKKAIEKVKEKRVENKKRAEEKPLEETAPIEETPELKGKPSEKQSETAEPKIESKKKLNENKLTQTKNGNVDVKGKQDKTTVKEKTQAPPKSKQQADTLVDEIKKPRQRKQTAPKTKGQATIKKVGAEKQTVKTVNSEARKIKRSKRSLDNTVKGIKKADKMVKTANKVAKKTSSTTKKTAEVAKRTKQTAQATARVTVKTIKVATKVIIEAGKAVVTGVKSIGAAIAAGGVPAIVIVIIICLIGAIGGTCFGIFLANDETTGTQKTMSMAISELTSEHYANLTAMKASYTYDLLEVQGNTSINWKDVLAVYAVKTTSGDNPLEVVTLDDVKLNLLRDIMKDMNTMTGVVVPKLVAETSVTIDDDGNSIKTTTYVTKKVLIVTIVQLNKDEITQLYNFNDEQKSLLDDLMSDEYSDLWGELLGASGQIIQSGSSFVGTGMFAWPFEHDHNITSRFGTRVDPISGEIKTHGGTDIAAPLGTPILAAADGVVVAATWHNTSGYYVRIKHNNTYSTLYAHCSVLYVTAGQEVKQGQVIADCGSTGYSTGPHLHYEVIQNGVRVDALNFYKQE
jgi:murein DD-endopeptidase MepM/ murein hydrolase activator NlpD